MVATDATIDSFVQNSMAFLRKNNFDGIDIDDWSHPAFCESPDRCSPPGDAERFKVLLEKFRNAIESENVLPEDKMIISSMAGHKKNQIYKANDETSTTSAPLQGTAALISNVTASFSPTSNSTETISFMANSTELSLVPIEASDLKIEIWAPVVAVFLLAVIIALIVWRVKRANEKVTKNSVRSDRKTSRKANIGRNRSYMSDYENYGSVMDSYTAYEDEYDTPYVEDEEHYAEYKKP